LIEIEDGYNKRDRLVW